MSVFGRFQLWVETCSLLNQNIAVLVLIHHNVNVFEEKIFKWAVKNKGRK